MNDTDDEDRSNLVEIEKQMVGETIDGKDAEPQEGRGRVRVKPTERGKLSQANTWPSSP